MRRFVNLFFILIGLVLMALCVFSVMYSLIYHTAGTLLFILGAAVVYIIGKSVDDYILNNGDYYD